MNKIIKYIPSHFLVGIIIGILIQYYYTIWSLDSIHLFICLFSLTIILFTCIIFREKTVFTITAFLLFIMLGICTMYIQTPENNRNYYEKFCNKTIVTKKFITIKKVLKPSKYHNRYEGIVSQINNTQTTGAIILRIKKDSIREQNSVNDIIFTSSSFKSIRSNLNPYLFNYKQYLSKKGINHQITINKENFKTVAQKSFSINGVANNIKNTIKQKLSTYKFSKNELAVINALLLGERKEITKDLQNDYINAGAIHILAISGLHIGILLLILTWVLKPLKKIKHGEVIKILVLLICLWSFAVLTGLSASVVRAVTMFTFIVIGKSINKNNTLHSLITSAFVLLLIHPIFIFDIGFQLSYLAVFGIVWIQPLLYRNWKPNIKIIDKLWQLTTVSIAAQISVLPISLYYFHQFPSLFLVSNLVIIPFLGLILIGGVVTITLALLNLLPQFLADFYGYIITILNNFVSFISKQEQFLFKEIGISLLLMVVLYLFIILGYQFILKRDAKQFSSFLIAIILLQLVFIIEKNETKNKQEFIVFNKSRVSIIGSRKGNSLDLFTSIDSTMENSIHFIDAYAMNEQITSIQVNRPQNIFKFNNTFIVAIDSLGIYDVNIKNPMLILQNSPKINLNRVIKKLQPNKIIADGSNYTSYIKRWKKTCEKEKIPFHQTRENGAFIISK